MSTPEQDVIDYLAGRLPKERESEVTVALANPTSPISHALAAMEQAGRRRTWLQPGLITDAPPTAEVELKPVSQKLAEPSPSPRPRADRWPRPLHLAVAALLLIGAAVLTHNLQSAKAEADPKVSARLAEEGKLEARAASDVSKIISRNEEEGKLEAQDEAQRKRNIARLKTELRRRLETTILLIEKQPDPGESALFRATLFYDILSLYGPAGAQKGQLAPLFSTYPEFQNLSTRQLTVQLLDNIDASNRVKSKDAELAAYNKEREAVTNVLTALDELSAKHLGFKQEDGYKAFEADLLKIYPGLIAKLGATK
jgi:hypothetical protein